MKSLSLVLAILVTSSISSAAYINSYSVKGCSFWSYSNDAKGYVCSSPDIAQRVPDAYDVQSVINDLERKNQDLERRLRILESAIH